MFLGTIGCGIGAWVLALWRVFWRFGEGWRVGSRMVFWYMTTEENVLNVFHEMDVNTPGRAVAYLTLVYRMNHILKEETVRKAVRLTAPVLKNAGRVDTSFIRRLLCSSKYGFLNLWDLF